MAFFACAPAHVRGQDLVEIVSLCQPDDRKSCGACCGIYNYATSAKDDLIERLGARTERFLRIPHSLESIQAFSQWVRKTEPQHKLLETIYNCEFVGFLDDEFKRVGCLLHPAQNHGIDLRGSSFYGAELCAAHRCQSYDKLDVQEKYGVIYALDDWFLYGLCITDIDLVKNFFFHVSILLGERPKVDVLSNDRVRRALASFLVLKVQWPFRDRGNGRFGKYCLAEDEYREARIPYDRLGSDTSRYDGILLSLASAFSSGEELKAAEQLVSERIGHFVDVYREVS